MTKLTPDILPRLVHKGDLSGIRRLLAEANPPIARPDLGRALISALGRNEENAPIVRLLLEHGADPEHCIGAWIVASGRPRSLRFRAKT
jgi:hypothetical protein